MESGITMKAQVSVYPLRREHLSPAVEAVRKKLEAYGLFPAVGAISTDISGEAEAVFAALRDAFVQVAADGQVVMSITVSNACPR